MNMISPCSRQAFCQLAQADTFQKPIKELVLTTHDESAGNKARNANKR